MNLEITLSLVLPFFRHPSNLFSIYYMTRDRQYLHSLAMSQSQSLHSYFFSIDLLIQFLVRSLSQNFSAYLILFATIHIFAWPLGCRAEREFWNIKSIFIMAYIFFKPQRRKANEGVRISNLNPETRMNSKDEFRQGTNITMRPVRGVGV